MRVARGLEVAAGALVLWIAAWKVLAWSRFLASLVGVAPAWRPFVGVGLTVGELAAGLGVLLARRRETRGAFLVAYASTLAGGRVALDVPATCNCLGPALPAAAAVAVLLALGLGGLALMGAWAASVLAPIGFALGLAVGGGLAAPADPGVDGEVGTAPGRYSLSLRAGEAVRAESSCQCLAVVGVDGPTIDIAVREPVPPDLEPYLTVWIREAGATAVRRIEVAVPLAR